MRVRAIVALLVFSSLSLTTTVNAGPASSALRAPDAWAVASAALGLDLAQGAIAVAECYVYESPFDAADVHLLAFRGRDGRLTEAWKDGGAISLAHAEEYIAQSAAEGQRWAETEQRLRARCTDGTFGSCYDVASFRAVFAAICCPPGYAARCFCNAAHGVAACDCNG